LKEKLGEVKGNLSGREKILWGERNFLIRKKKSNKAKDFFVVKENFVCRKKNLAFQLKNVITSIKYYKKFNF
jgi:hypothetical protein